MKIPTPTEFSAKRFAAQANGDGAKLVALLVEALEKGETEAISETDYSKEAVEWATKQFEAAGWGLYAYPYPKNHPQSLNTKVRYSVSPRRDYGYGSTQWYDR